MNPRRMRRATIRNPAAINASTAANATYSSEPVEAIPARLLAKMAAVAESAPTTRCREEPNTANSAVGDEHGVETGDHRRAGDLGVAHHFGDGERGQCDAGNDLGRDPSGRDRQHPLQDGETDDRGAIVSTRCRHATPLPTLAG